METLAYTHTAIAHEAGNADSRDRTNRAAQRNTATDCESEFSFYVSLTF